ncbi:MAG TPA: alpha-1,4-glucan--maltose-1-phosphate maltosyltransferase [Burkholderiales bacterium]|nr:alpha-1,4-glucan--maltose-1-phosphate maltosyltransferase [Burkholderiales bacterium]
MAEAASGLPAHDGRVRAVIDAVRPAIDDGRFALKRIAGDRFTVEADCFADGHDALRAVLRWRAETDVEWREVEMQPLGNDRWRAELLAGAPGRYRYTVSAWVDHFQTWLKELLRREEAGDIRLAALAGAALVDECAARARGAARKRLAEWAARMRTATDLEPAELKTVCLEEPLLELAARFPERSLAASWPLELPLVVDRERARFGSWYEMFPRSAAAEPGRHGTLRDCEARLPYLAELGFDVLYLPPIHPIGRAQRKGRNNTLAGGPEDVGSPWAIGAEEGGHKSVHPALGTLEDFGSLLAKAGALGIEIALDIAFQCAPDHPYVKAHPQWFRRRPDGSVQYAENPPKRYQDIYPFDFETADWRSLWAELKSVFDFWIGQGVKIFRVDNPHTKSFAFWEWAIDAVRREHPEVIFLGEAFTRSKVMHRLAKLGFTQSYTYFAWRNTRAELAEYFSELAHGPGREYFRPNAWPNTPDILTETLQFGGRGAFMARLILAATLCANYGIYGPAFELLECEPLEPGSEEYRDSEKYQLRHWDLERSDSLHALIALVNRIRRDNPALQSDWSLRFFPTDNEQLLCYAKSTEDGANQIVTVVNLDPRNVHSGWIELDLAALGIAAERPYQMHDLITGARFLWQGPRNFVQLDPQRVPAHIFRVRRRVRREQDFDYFA